MRIWSVKLVFFCLFSVVCLFAFGDKIYLKNGRSMEGVIEKESDASVTLNVGIGKVSVRKSDIDRIVRYDDEGQGSLKDKWSRKYFTQPEFVPPNLKDIADDFQRLERVRSEAIRKRNLKGDMLRNIETLEKELEELNKKAVEAGNKMSAANPKKNVKAYNLLVSDYNSLNARVQAVRSDIGELRKQIKDADRDISQYVYDLKMFKIKVNERGEYYAGRAGEQEVYFLRSINGELADIENDFVRHSIEYSREGSSVMVDALLNGGLKVRLMVDTGASMVVISEDVAMKLGIDSSKKKESFTVTLADGKQVNALPIVLQSLSVGGVEVKNVRAAVLGRDKSVTGNGLLGMSFLENFVVSIDSNSNRLILEEFKP